MAGPEQRIQARIIKWLESQGYVVVKVVSANKRGVSDILACSPEGKFLAIEVKTPGKKPTPLQLHFLQQIKDARGMGVWVDSLEKLQEFLSV